MIDRVKLNVVDQVTSQPYTLTPPFSIPKVEEVKKQLGALANRPGRPKQQLARERERIAFNLRLQGKSYSEIAEAVGVSEIGAYQMITRVLTRGKADTEIGRAHV